MLWTLLVRYLRPAWPLIIAVIVFQLAQSIASLLLPTLNADIIDNGVVTGDIAYIWSTGGLMLVISLVQVVCAIIAVYFGSRLAMGMGKNLRADVFHRVSTFMISTSCIRRRLCRLIALVQRLSSPHQV